MSSKTSGKTAKGVAEVTLPGGDLALLSMPLMFAAHAAVEAASSNS